MFILKFRVGEQLCPPNSVMVQQDVLGILQELSSVVL